MRASLTGVGLGFAAALSKNTVAGTDYLVTRITVTPCGGTGRHYHPGEVFGFIKEGTMTHDGTTHYGTTHYGGCTVDAVYDAGAPVEEGVGPGLVHYGRNLGSTPLLMEVVYINPTRAPLSVEVAGPSDCPVQ